MTSELKFFTFEVNEVRVMTIGNEHWFVAKDVCDVLDIEDTGKAISRLDEDESTRIEIDHPQSATKKIEAYAVNEFGLYSLVLGSRKPEAKKFKRWITHDVLPTIRKTGGYVANDEMFIDTYLTHADDQTKLLFKATLNTVRLQNEKIAILQPKASKFDQFLNSDGYMTMNDIAKILTDTVKGVGRNKLFEFLRHKNILMKDNTPYQKYMTQGRFKVTEKPSQSGYTNKVTLCTVKGFDFIADLVAEGYAEWKESRVMAV